ncbi:MAG: PhzF family phenazine biosynthesis protein [Actinomycetota bacterium]|nr:PhzF family phenazine biosynthesis protein [Actinomycetota bacterium]MDH5313535.1 PhzF family phenazine biosynthesis protein [Actinomycetota bacterium]
MRVPFRLLDVFAETPFAGNQLCVVPDVPDGLDADTMLTLAREIAFSETTFVTAVRGDGYDVRIFTPDGELAFAGHPTIGTAFLLAAEGRAPRSLVQTCGAGDVPVEVDLDAGRATMHQLPPVFSDPVEDRAGVAAGAGLELDDLVADLPIVSASTGIAHLMVPVRDEATLRRAERDARACHAACRDADAESLYLFTVRSDGDLMARMFDRFQSIGEDPATGSAAGPLGAYLSRHRLAGMPGRAIVSQGEIVGRPSALHLDVAPDGDSWAIRVSGRVHVMGEGAFTF